MNEIIKEIFSNPIVIVTAMGARGYLNWMPDSVYLKILFRGLTGQKLNLKNPKKYNEKLQWLKLHDRKEEYSMMVDKYAVRQYIADKLGEEYLIPCIGVWEKVEDIDFDKLPNQFVLKCTHDSGSVIICTDKALLDIESVKRKLNKACKRNYYNAYREWPYKNVKPRIIAEKYMIDLQEEDLRDYKVLCFDGKAKLIEVHQNRFNNKEHTQDFYDREWNNLHLAQKCLKNALEDIEKPERLEEVLDLSEVLAKDLKHVRMDWYIVKNTIYFGEITFYDGAGFELYPDKEELMLGELIRLD